MDKEAMNVSQDPAADEANRPEENVRLVDGFWYHKSVLVWCTIGCVGGFQLGEYLSTRLH